MISDKKTDHWLVKTSLAMPMTLILKYKGKTIITYKPREKQWWVTGFNPYYQEIGQKDLSVVYTIHLSGNHGMFTSGR